MRSPYVTAARRFGNYRWFARMGSRFGHRFDLLTYPWTAGRVRFAAGLPTLLLTTHGRRTGQLRTMPLLFVRDGEAFVVVGSNWRRADHPGWSANLLANPAATVQVGAQRVDVQAKLVHGPERDRLWAQLREMWRVIQNSTIKIANGPLACADAGRGGADKGLLNNPRGHPTTLTGIEVVASCACSGWSQSAEGLASSGRGRVVARLLPSESARSSVQRVAAAGTRWHGSDQLDAALAQRGHSSAAHTQLRAGYIRRYPPGSHSGIVVLHPADHSAAVLRGVVSECAASSQLEVLTGLVTVVQHGPLRIRCA